MQQNHIAERSAVAFFELIRSRCVRLFVIGKACGAD